jgi:hypothetical protein
VSRNSCLFFLIFSSSLGVGNMSTQHPGLPQL